MGCTGDLPLSGVGGGHFHEACLGKELMTPILKWKHDQHFSAISFGVLEDMGYTVDLSQQDSYTVDDLGDCGDYCPAAGRRRLGSPERPAPPQLSEKAEMELLQAAAERFRTQDRRLRKLQQEESVDPDMRLSGGNSVAYLYEEDGHLFSRTIHRRQVEHLL